MYVFVEQILSWSTYVFFGNVHCCNVFYLQLDNKKNTVGLRIKLRPHHLPTPSPPAEAWRDVGRLMLRHTITCIMHKLDNYHECDKFFYGIAHVFQNLPYDSDFQSIVQRSHVFSLDPLSTAEPWCDGRRRLSRYSTANKILCHAFCSVPRQCKKKTC